MVDRFGAAKFLAFLENPNPRETEFWGFFGVFEFLGFLKQLSFWVWSH